MPAYALAAYRGAARQLVLSYKERGRRDLGPPLGRLLAGGCAHLVPALEPLVLVPAPSRAASSRVRGGPHVQRLAEHCAAALAEAGRPTAVAPALRLAAGVRDAVGLDAARRAVNLAGRVQPVPAGAPPPGSAVVLLDDVLTTGATAAACIQALASIDVRVRAVLTLTSPRAGTPRVGYSLSRYEPPNDGNPTTVGPGRRRLDDYSRQIRSGVVPPSA